MNKFFESKHIYKLLIIILTYKRINLIIISEYKN